MRDATSGVAEQSRYREFGEAEITGYAGEGVPKDIRRYVLQFGFGADTVQDPNLTRLYIATRLEARLRGPVFGCGANAI